MFKVRLKSNLLSAKTFFYAGLGLLFSCATYQAKDGTSIDEMSAKLQQARLVNQKIDDKKGFDSARLGKVLMPGLQLDSATTLPFNRQFDVAVKDVPAKAFFLGLTKDTPINIIVSPEVKGKISLNLKRVTIPQVLQSIESLYGYTARKTSSGYEILPNKIESKIYMVNYLELERKGRSNMTISSGQVSSQSQNQSTTSSSGGSSTSNSASVSNTIGDVETKSTINFWKQLQLTLENIIGKENGRAVTVNPVAGVVVVRAYPKELKQVELYLDAVQNSMDRQVILEAKILEVILNNEYQMGIDWKIFGARLNALNTFPRAQIDQSEFPPAFQVNVKWDPESFTTTMQALETQGNIQVLSSPRVSTMNNQKAAIKVGNDQYFVTNVSSSQTQTTGGAVTPTQDVELTPFFSGITLDVTPQIDGQGDITLHIHPSVSEVRSQQKEIDLGENGTLTLPLANSTIRESDTIVHAKNGQVVVIGGLMENHTKEGIAGFPPVANIPYLGTLFRGTRQNSRKSELVILLRPVIVSRGTMTEKVKGEVDRFRSLRQGFHVGSRPDIYGTEGEKPLSLGPKAGINGISPSIG